MEREIVLGNHSFRRVQSVHSVSDQCQRDPPYPIGRARPLPEAIQEEDLICRLGLVIELVSFRGLGGAVS